MEESYQTAIVWLFLLVMLLIVYGTIEATKEEIKLQRLSKENEIDKRIKRAVRDERLEMEKELEAFTVIDNTIPRPNRGDWIELPDEGACLQALPEPKK